MPKDVLDKQDLKSLTEIDRVVHEPARLLILAYLSAVESCDFLFLMNQTGLTRGNLSSHMGKLESAGYIEISKEFVNRMPRTLYRLTKDGRKAIRAYGKDMKKILDNLIE